MGQAGTGVGYADNGWGQVGTGVGYADNGWGQAGTGWVRLARDGLGWHGMGQASTGWIRLARDRVRLARVTGQTGTRETIL